MRLEDTKRLAIVSDHLAAYSPNASTDSVRWGDEQLTRGKLLYKDLAIGAESEALNPMRESHDVAVADSPDLDDLHRSSIHAYIRFVKQWQTRTAESSQVASARRLRTGL